MGLAIREQLCSEASASGGAAWRCVAALYRYIQLQYTQSLRGGVSCCVRLYVYTCAPADGVRAHSLARHAPRGSPEMIPNFTQPAEPALRPVGTVTGAQSYDGISIPTCCVPWPGS